MEDKEKIIKIINGFSPELAAEEIIKLLKIGQKAAPLGEKVWILYDEHGERIGTETWIKKDGHLEYWQKWGSGLGPKEGVRIPQPIQHASKEEIN